MPAARSFLGSIILVLLLISTVTNAVNYQYQSWPHNHYIGNQLNARGRWMTNAGGLSTPKTGSGNVDKIQPSANREGIYIGHGRKALHIFSSHEARYCLRNRRVIFAGDSYIVQMAIGLMDILLNAPDNQQIIGGVMRTEVLKMREGQVQALLNKPPWNIDVRYEATHCRHSGFDCFMDYFFQREGDEEEVRVVDGQAGDSSGRHGDASSGLLNETRHDSSRGTTSLRTSSSSSPHGSPSYSLSPSFVKSHQRRGTNLPTDAVVMNVLVHHVMNLTASQKVNFRTHSVEQFAHSNYINATKEFLRAAKEAKLPLTWISGPSGRTYTQQSFREFRVHRNSTQARYNAAALIAAREAEIPSINIFPMTALCTWQNCTSEGSHRSRFVNRMKAQLLLNTMCYSPKDEPNVQLFKV